MMSHDGPSILLKVAATQPDRYWSVISFASRRGASADKGGTMAMGVTTAYRFSVNTLSNDAFEVVEFTGEEAISKPFRFEFVLASTDADLDLAPLIGETAQFTIT